MIPGIVASQMRAAGGVVSGYPEVRGAPVFTGTGSTSVTSLDADLPTNEAGDLILVFHTSGGTNQIGARPSGWNRWEPAQNYAVYWRISTGGLSTVTCNNSTSRTTAVLAVVVKAGTFDSSMMLSMVRAITSTDTQVTPTLTALWGVRKNLWLAFALNGVATTGGVVSYPLPDNQINAAGTARMGLCTASTTAETLSPGAFTMSTSSNGGAATVAISPPITGASRIPKTVRIVDEIIASATSQTIPLPGGWEPGQLCVICTTNNANTNSEAASGMTGWTRVSTGAGAGTANTHEIWYRVLQTGDSNPTIIATSAVTRSAVVMTFAAGTFDPTTPVIETAIGLSTENTATPAVAASGSSYDGDYLLCSSVGHSGLSGNTRTIVDWPNVGNNLLAASARGTAVCFAPHNSGVTPAASYTLSGTAGWVMVTFLIKAAP